MFNSKRAKNATLNEETPLPIWFAGAAQAEISRWRAMTLVMIVLLIVEPMLYTRFLAKRTVEPIFVEAGSSGSLRVLDAHKADDFRVDKRHIEAALGRWVIATKRIQAESVRQDVKDSSSLVVGAAVGQFRELLDRDQPVARVKDNPNLRREVEIRTVSFPSDNTAVVFFTTTDRSGAEKLSSSPQVAKLTFALDATKTQEMSDLLVSPIGLRITNFEFRRDSDA